MARPKNPVPVYKHHSSTGLARCWVNGKWVSLGKYDSPESRAEFARVLAELDAGAPQVSRTSESDATVDECLLAFWKHAEQHYRRPDGTPTNEPSEYRQAFKPLRRLYGHTPASSFGPVALKTVRAEMVKLGWSRVLINRRVGRIRRCFKWCASEELVPVRVFQGLGTVTGLQRGRSAAPETKPVLPVAWEHVLATLPHLPPHPRAMVEVQRLTGMRPGEVCALRPCDVDRSGRVWAFRPPHSKMAHKGRERVIMIGPQAQAILDRFEPPAATDFYFSPRESVRITRADRAARRKTPRYSAPKRVKNPRRQPAAKYSTSSYDKAITKAIERANRRLIEAAVEIELHIPDWHPNQLRHAHGTEVRRRHGLEGAQVALGHARADVTQVYAERDRTLAARIAAEMG